VGALFGVVLVVAGCDSSGSNGAEEAPTLDEVTADASTDGSTVAGEPFTLQGSGEKHLTDGSTTAPDSLLLALEGTQIRALVDTSSAEVDTTLDEGTYQFKVESYGEGPQGTTDRATATKEIQVAEGRMLPASP